ncbi:MAG: MFS transporter [Clostridia bacterium]|nr:MFS transporter [Clostridia bacterium]
MSKELSMNKPQRRLFGCTGNMWIYALGVMGINLAIGLVNSYQAEFFNKILHANLMAIAVIILVAKIVSIIADFVIGNLIDRARFKSGKMRPWILISAFPLAVFTMLSFVFIPFDNLPGAGADAARYIYISFILIVWNVSMTLADIPSQGMLSFVSKDPADTNNAAGIANTLKSAALAISGLFITVVCMLTGSGDVGEKEYLITAGIMCGIGLVLQLLMYFKCKEMVKSTTSSAMSFKEMFKELKNNKMILIVLITYLLGFGRNIGLGIAVQATCILLRDGVNFSAIPVIGQLFPETMYGDACSWAIGITSAISSMVVILLNPVINKKLGEKKYFIIAGLYGFILSFTSFLLYALIPVPEGASSMAWTARSLWAIWIYQFFFSVAYAPNAYLPMVMTADIVDYQEWKTGKRTEGTQFAILSMSNKLSNALSVSLGILLIGAIGYSSSDYNAAVQGGTAAIHAYVTDDMQVKAWAIYFLVPGLCMLASSIPMFFYKIDKKTKEEMRAELARRRAEAEQEQLAEGTEEVAEDAVEAPEQEAPVEQAEQEPVEQEPKEE